MSPDKTEEQFLSPSVYPSNQPFRQADGCRLSVFSLFGCEYSCGCVQHCKMDKSNGDFKSQAWPVACLLRQAGMRSLGL